MINFIILKVEPAELKEDFFHDHNFTLKYHIHNSSALCFDMQPYRKFYHSVFEGKNGLKVKFLIKAT